jgi:para-aminobenzoate synthetase component 1
MHLLETDRHHMTLDPVAIVGGRCFTRLRDVTSDLSVLDSTGTWIVLVPYSGTPVCARFDAVEAASTRTGTSWPGLARDAHWTTSLSRIGFEDRVETIRAHIAAGDVYQVNLTRRLSAPLPEGADIVALGATLTVGNPAPFAALLHLPDPGIHVASASPERFLERSGAKIWSSPIKGTAATPDGFLAKDRAENVMIVDLVRNDLGRVCDWGSIQVPALCAVEEHPGLAHLVSTVEGRLRADAGWPDILAATFPPGSVTGTPKIAAIEMIDELEPVPRGPYCGALGWVDADRSTASLNVAIRTFWFDEGAIHFGTGGGITWGSSPSGEWAETELKATRLVDLASGPAPSGSR